MRRYQLLILLFLGSFALCSNFTQQLQDLFVPSRKAGHLVYLSGIASGLKGVVGKDITVEQAAQAAQDIAKAHIEEIKAQAGGLNNVRIVKVNGYVRSELGFGNQPDVLNAYSSHLISVFGKERGEHARTTIGVADLPGGSSVEIELIIEIM